MGRTFRLLPRDGSATFQKIMEGRNWIGRVTQHDDGEWLGIIGKTMLKRPTKVQAFDDIVAEHCGYKSGADMQAHNQRVRRAKRVVNQAADAVYQGMLRGNFKPLDIVHKGRPVGMELALRGATRDLRRFNRRKP